MRFLDHDFCCFAEPQESKLPQANPASFGAAAVLTATLRQGTRNTPLSLRAPLKFAAMDAPPL